MLKKSNVIMHSKTPLFEEFPEPPALWEMMAEAWEVFADFKNHKLARVSSE